MTWILADNVDQGSIQSQNSCTSKGGIALVVPAGSDLERTGPQIFKAILFHWREQGRALLRVELAARMRSLHLRSTFLAIKTDERVLPRWL